MYIINGRLHREFGIPTVMKEIKIKTLQKRFEEYLNQPAAGLMNPKRVFWKLKKKISTKFNYLNLLQLCIQFVHS